MRVRYLFLLLVLALSFASLDAQTKPWSEWSKKDAERVLNDSSWGQSFSIESQATDTTVVTNTRGGMTGDRRTESGEPVASKALHYRARLLTAKPIREAFARLIVLQQKDANPDLANQLQGFIDRDFGDYLVVSFSADSEDPRRSQGFQVLLGKLTGEAAKPKVSLMRGDGKAAAFVDYKPPVGDGMGGKFVFSRTLDGSPFLSESDESLRFVFEVNEKQKITMKFKVSGMSYGGKLEY